MPDEVDLPLRAKTPKTWARMALRARLSARASNTEPIMRIIAEAPTKEMAEQRIGAVKKVVDQTLGR